MMEKITWYQEVLEQEPGSKVFFPLAKLLVEASRADKALAVLRNGLVWHPDFLEARLLLIHLLHEQGIHEECHLEVHKITSLLALCPSFWEAWAEASSHGKQEQVLAVRLLASIFRNPGLTLTHIFERGLQTLDSFDASSPACTPAVPPFLDETVDSLEPETSAEKSPEELIGEVTTALDLESDAEPDFDATILSVVEDVLAAEDHVAATPEEQPSTAAVFDNSDLDDELPLPEASEDSLSIPSPFEEIASLMASAEEDDSFGETTHEMDLEGEAFVSCEADQSLDEALASASSLEDAIATSVEESAQPAATVSDASTEAEPAPSNPLTKASTSVAEFMEELAEAPVRLDTPLPLETEDAEEAYGTEEPTLRTRSMAEVLAEQGDLAGAIEIYQELEAAAPSSEEAAILHERVVALAAQLGSASDNASAPESEDEDDEERAGKKSSSQHKMRTMLESLANRLEARAKA